MCRQVENHYRSNVLAPMSQICIQCSNSFIYIVDNEFIFLKCGIYSQATVSTGYQNDGVRKKGIFIFSPVILINPEVLGAEVLGTDSFNKM